MSLQVRKLQSQSQNKALKEIAEARGLTIIPPLKELSFEGTKPYIKRIGGNKYSYDGEHLKPAGYRLWIKHIKEHL